MEGTISRHHANYIIMSVLYEVLLTLDNSEDKTFIDPTPLIKDMCEEGEDTYYIEKVVYESLSHYSDILSVLTPKLRNWRWERLPLLTRAILLMSYAHYYYVEEVDKRIVIDVAVNLAKEYVDEKQAKFINALLDGVLV